MLGMASVSAANISSEVCIEECKEEGRMKRLIPLMSYYYERDVQECINTGSEFQLIQSSEIKINVTWEYDNSGIEES